MAQCPLCNDPNQHALAITCTNCGQPMRVCGSCGFQNPLIATACSSCGKAFGRKVSIFERVASRILALLGQNWLGIVYLVAVLGGLVALALVTVTALRKIPWRDLTQAIQDNWGFVLGMVGGFVALVLLIQLLRAILRGVRQHGGVFLQGTAPLLIGFLALLTLLGLFIRNPFIVLFAPFLGWRIWVFRQRRNQGVPVREALKKSFRTRLSVAYCGTWLISLISHILGIRFG